MVYPAYFRGLSGVFRSVSSILFVMKEVCFLYDRMNRITRPRKPAVRRQVADPLQIEMTNKTPSIAIIVLCILLTSESSSILSSSLDARTNLA